MRKFVLAALFLLTCVTGCYADGLDANVVYLNHFDGVDGALEVTDSGNTGHIVAENNTAVIQTTAKVFGTGALFLDGNSDYLTIADSDDWNVADGAFTFNARVYMEDLGNYTVFGIGDYIAGGGWMMYIDNTNSQLEVGYYASGNSTYNKIIEKSWSPSPDTWYDIELDRDADDNWYLFVNGTILDASVSNSVSLPNSTETFNLGARRHNGSYYSHFKGYIDEVRFTKGEARHTSNFTSASSAFTSDANTKLLLHLDTQDVSPTTPHVTSYVGDANRDSAQKKFGATSLRLDGDDSATVAANSDFSFGTGNWTIDFWIRFSSFSNDRVPFDLETYATGIRLNFSSTSTLEMYVDNIRTNGSLDASISTDTWYHIAVERYGNTCYVYQDGVLCYSYSIAAADLTTETNGFTVGAQIGPSQNMAGWIDELRVSNIARYEGTGFTPPSAPYSEVSSSTSVIQVIGDGMDW